MSATLPTKLSHHFTAEEATRSAKARELRLSNSPATEYHAMAITYTASQMEVVRAILGHRSIVPSSWYRNPQVNAAVGGSRTSDHMTGYSVDFTCPAYGSPRDICLKLMQYKDILRYDQLILEPSWVHISFAPSKRGEERTKVGNNYPLGIS